MYAHSIILIEYMSLDLLQRELLSFRVSASPLVDLLHWERRHRAIYTSYFILRTADSKHHAHERTQQ